MQAPAYRDRATGAYPVALDSVRARANALFGETPPQSVLDEVGVDPVEVSQSPAYDPATQILSEAAPVRVGDVWRQAWTVSAIPPSPEVFGAISDRQFFQALAMQPYAIITTQEALDAVKTGDIPQVMQAVIDTLPPEQQFGATMILAGGTSYERSHPLVAAFGASRGMDATAINTFWRFAQGL